MIIYVAHFIDVACSRVSAWILALVVDARLIAGTLRIAATAQEHTRFSWISAQSRWAFAHSTMIDSIAFGTFAARPSVHRADRCTLTIDT